MIGQPFGPYEVVAKLGQGGMGEVYRARDTRLKRDVALKILPPSFAADPDRLARFQREAEILASLNHPHIAAIHGVQDADGVRALVMELVEGDTLADRIARGPIPLDEALAIAAQIAEALHAAHEQGIVHRDLKPLNIKLRPDGTVKVLDFGLAKAMLPAAAAGSAFNAADLVNSPTITGAAATQVGIILGTAAYMAPEQARGKPTDKRADVWAFGCVLFEMLTGKRAFEGEDVSDTLAELLKRDPDWSALPASTPEPIRRLLRRCLIKDPRRRLSDMAAARLEIDDAVMQPGEAATSAGSTPPGGRLRARIGWSVAVVFMAAAAGLALVHFRETPAATPTMRFSFVTPAARNYPNNLALSPDGRSLAFVAYDADGARALWLRPFNSLTAHAIAGTDNAVLPFWSPDNRYIGFFGDGKLKTVDVLGGAPQTLADATDGAPGGTWSREGTILFGGGDGIYSVPALGGASKRVTMLDGARGEVLHNLPSFLPDGRHFLYQRRGNDPTGTGIYLASLDAPGSTLVVRSDAKAEYVAPGYLLFVRGGTLMAQRFDATRLQASGDPFPVVERVSFNAGNGQAAFSASDAGVLTYRAPAASGGAQLQWTDRSGKQLQMPGARELYRGPELSPDEASVAVGIRDPGRGTIDMWLLELARGIRTRFTFDTGDEYGGRWSPTGDRVAYLKRGSGLYVRRANGAGTAQPLIETAQAIFPDGWSADGRFLLYEVEDPKTSWDLWLQPMPSGQPWPLVQADFRQEYGRISPDGKWVAYSSNESGRSEVYVTPFTTPDTRDADASAGAKWQVSVSGGGYARWRRDGRELYYLGLDNNLMAAEVPGGDAGFKVGAVRPLFTIAPGTADYPYDVSRDGQRFLIANVVDAAGGDSIAVVLNWASELAK